MKKAEIIKLLKPKCNGYDLPMSLNIELIADLLVENQKPTIAVNGCCVGEAELLNFKKGDYLTYVGGSATKYLSKGNKYRTTWNGTNAAGKVAVVGIDKKRLVMPIRFFTI